ncbi:MAG: lysozyme inhibitor LprI family protein [Xanthobacteraceae bacterium]
MRIAALAVIMTLSVAGVRAEDARPYPVADCGKFTTQMDLNKCAAENLQSADKALNGAYQALMAKQDDAASKRRLKDAQRAWIAFRDRECAFEIGPRETGGTIWPTEVSGCLEEITATRIRALTQLRSCMPIACPAH